MSSFANPPPPAARPSRDLPCPPDRNRKPSRSGPSRFQDTRGCRPDVCRVLKEQNVTKVIACLDDDENSVSPFETSSGIVQRLRIINAYAVKSLTFQSDVPHAKTFRQWVEDNIIMPAFDRRVDGSYARTATHDAQSAPSVDAAHHFNSSKTTNNHCKGITKRYPLPTAGGVQEVRVMSEPEQPLTEPAPTSGGAGLPVVFTRDGAVFTNSRDVADFFEKRHDNVLRDISNLLKSCHPSKLRDERFQEVKAPHPTVPGRFDRSFDMTRDGFTLLAMGFTGEKALAFKEKYIQQFNAMEAVLRGQATPGAELTEVAARQIADLRAEIAASRAETAELAAQVRERLIAGDSRVSVVTHRTAVYLCDQQKIPSHGRRGFTKMVQNRLVEAAHNSTLPNPMFRTTERGVPVFSEYLIRYWLNNLGGHAMMRDRRVKVANQFIMNFAKPRRKRAKKAT